MLSISIPTIAAICTAGLMFTVGTVAGIAIASNTNNAKQYVKNIKDSEKNVEDNVKSLFNKQLQSKEKENEPKELDDLEEDHGMPISDDLEEEEHRPDIGHVPLIDNLQNSYSSNNQQAETSKQQTSQTKTSKAEKDADKKAQYNYPNPMLSKALTSNLRENEIDQNIKY
ncbi:hypothetical protein [Candidatus Xenohaliotis californiensis]